jgi:hypothetical protein
MPDVPNNLTDDETVYFATLHAAEALADCCQQLRGRDFAAGRDPLGHAINALMTALGDRSFSQSEIRTGFTSATNDMNRYAAGQERR